MGDNQFLTALTDGTKQPITADLESKTSLMATAYIKQAQDALAKVFICINLFTLQGKPVDRVWKLLTQSLAACRLRGPSHLASFHVWRQYGQPSVAFLESRMAAMAKLSDEEAITVACQFAAHVRPCTFRNF